MDDHQLQASLHAAKAGRSDGYQAILAAYGPRLYGYFYRATGNHDEAEDLIGEVMLRVVRVLDSYDERGRFEPWLFRIAANLIRDRIRRRRVAPPPLSLTGDSSESASLGDMLAGPAEAVDGRLMATETNNQLMDALNTLDESTRQMILLRHFADMSFAQIAELMGCPLGTALAKVHRGLKTLRARLERTAGGQT